VFTRVMQWAYLVFAWLILVAVIAQFFLAGLGVFAGADNFETHRMLGYTLTFVMLLGVLFAFAARLPWRTVGLTALLPVLVLLQSAFIAFWYSSLPGMAALHVINGLAIFSLAGFLAVRSRQYITAGTSVSAKMSALTS
jgi:hypothetical protein